MITMKACRVQIIDVSRKDTVMIGWLIGVIVLVILIVLLFRIL